MKFKASDFRSAKQCPVCSDCVLCVEVAIKDGHIGVRDSKLSDSPVLEFDKKEWQIFIAGVKAGEFDV